MIIEEPTTEQAPKALFANYTELPSRVPTLLWHALRIVSVLTALTVTILLFILPSLGLFIFWGIFIPLVPLLFFVAPGFWRNTCPMAALNQLPRLFRFSRNLTLPYWLQQYNYVIGICLLLLLIPARKVLFNHSGVATGLLVLLMLLLAFVQEHQCRHAVIAGGGLLGLEAGYALHKLGVSVSILERSERLLSRQLDRRGAQILRDYLERLGLKIVLKAETAALLGEGNFGNILQEKPKLREIFGKRALGSGPVTQVLLKDGRTLPCDLFLAAIGIQPNVQLAAQAALQINRGVVVDAAMRASDAQIFAVGDVAEYSGQVAGLWAPAVEQAEVAAINCIGGEQTYHGYVPVTMLKVVGVDLTSAGRIEPADEHETVIVLEEMIAGSEDRHYRKLVIAEGKIVGAILIGHPIDAPVVAEAIKQGVEVTNYLDALRSGDWGVLNRVVQV
jgi:NADPH-dependent 2,4-dienoyl-CoA reductase/sulfur reductase-like enzyme